MAWWVEHVDGVLAVVFGVTASLMGAGILRVSKAAIDRPDGRVQKARKTLTIVGPILVVIGIARIVVPSQSRQQWHEVTGDGKFSIMLPVQPEVKERAMDSPLGRVAVHSFTAFPEPKGVDYRIRYTDLPPPASYTNVPQSPDLSGMKDLKVIRQNSTTVSGFPAMVVEGEGPGGLSIKVQFVWVGARQYVIMRTAKPGARLFDDEFFSSFRVLAE